jgi:hypothetical protein
MDCGTGMPDDVVGPRGKGGSEAHTLTLMFADPKIPLEMLPDRTSH